MQVQVTVNNEIYDCDRAIKGTNYIKLYKNNMCIAEFLYISDFNGYSISGGEWSTPQPTEMDSLSAQVAYTAMMTDTLIEED